MKEMSCGMQCTFVCGLDDKSHADVLKGKFDGGTHFINAFKFVVVREERDKKKTGIMCLGGSFDPDIDGGNPEQYKWCQLLLSFCGV